MNKLRFQYYYPLVYEVVCNKKYRYVLTESFIQKSYIGKTYLERTEDQYITILEYSEI